MGLFSAEELQLFDAYLNDTLPRAQKEALEEQLASPEWAHRFRLYQTIVVQVKEEAAVEHQLKQRFQKLDKKRTTIKWFTYVGMAASILGIMVASFYFTPPKHHPGERLAQFKAQDPGLPIIMSGEAPLTWTGVMHLYKQKEYTEALKAVLQMAPSDTATFYTGLFAELAGQKEKAVLSYQALHVKEKQSTFRDKASYRLAILLWEKGEKAPAQTILKEIAQNPNHLYQGPAANAFTALITGK